MGWEVAQMTDAKIGMGRTLAQRCIAENFHDCQASVRGTADVQAHSEHQNHEVGMHKA